MEANVVAVVGAGVMGCDIALDVSSHKYTVILKDLTDELLSKAKGRIRKTYNLAKMMSKGGQAATFDELVGRIRFVTSYDHFREAEIVIESITESYEAKRELYVELAAACRDDAIFGTDTSCISVTKIGALMPKPENVIGMHFFNPALLKPFVEVVRGHHTSDATVDATRRFLRSLNKTCVVVNDLAGFVSNRVLMVAINESIWLVQDKVAEARDIDTIFKLGVGHKMGPLATADLIGLDTVLASLDVLYESYGDPKYRACPLLRKMVDAGLLGRKSGRGFFDYRA